MVFSLEIAYQDQEFKSILPEPMKFEKHYKDIQISTRCHTTSAAVRTWKLKSTLCVFALPGMHFSLPGSYDSYLCPTSTRHSYNIFGLSMLHRCPVIITASNSLGWGLILLPMTLDGEEQRIDSCSQQGEKESKEELQGIP